MLKVTGDATTQVILIEQDGGDAVSIYPAAVPRLIADLFQAAVILGLGKDYPLVPTTIKMQ